MNVEAPQRQRTTAREPFEVAREWLDQHGCAALATIISTWGSAPVPAGGQLVVGPDERFEGSVSGGCVEAEVILEATEAMSTGRPRLLEYGVSEETAWRAGLPCGGTVQILVQPLDRARDLDFLDAVLGARRSRAGLTVVTDVETGVRRLYDAAEAMPPDVTACVTKGESRIVETPDGRRFVQVLMPPVRVVIVGATHIGQILAELTRLSGYDVIVVDPRTAFASKERLGATQAFIDWPAPSLKSIGLDARTAVVAITHAAHLDDEALTAALRSNCIYIGALGSRKTHAKRLERLAAAGFDAEELGRIHAPVGLAIGAKGPGEIAVSILAEIVMVARGAG